MTERVVYPIQNSPNIFLFWCPACKYGHHIDTNRWTFNGDLIKPTVSPSLLIHPGADTPRCHIFIRDGRIQYLGDCTHSYAGQTIDMEPLPGGV